MLSIIVPVYDRPQETAELLESLARSGEHGFEVVIVEDGSRLVSEDAVKRYAGRLSVKYLYKENGGPAAARNYGAARASGDFFVFMDSDCIVPPGYIRTVTQAVERDGAEFFGGPDMAAGDFTPFQKAVDYSMTSFFTTGGIRGSRSTPSDYCPRSFNMGISRSLFEKAGGFEDMLLGEDTDFALRVIRSGTRPVRLADAAVYHKRRTDMKAFFRQVFRFGVGRAALGVRHPGTTKAVYLLPAAFTVGSAAVLALGLLAWPWLLPAFAVPPAVWFAESTARNRSVRVGLLSVLTSFVQVYGYGAGYLTGWWELKVMRKSEKEVFRLNSFRKQGRKA